MNFREKNSNTRTIISDTRKHGGKKLSFSVNNSLFSLPNELKQYWERE
jgi:hypothetical protein